MAVSDWLGRRNSVVAGAAKAMLGTIVCIAGNVGCGRQANDFDTPVSAFTYTADNGATYFSANQELNPPVTPDGKPAVRAHVGRFAADGRIEVIWMERNAQGKNPVEAKTPAMKEWKSFPSEAAKMAWVATVKSRDNKLFTYVN